MDDNNQIEGDFFCQLIQKTLRQEAEFGKGNSGKYSDWFDMFQVGKDKGLNEQGIVYTLLETLRLESEVSIVIDDPPDCSFKHNGKRIGVEVTILVHQKTRENHIRAKRNGLLLPDWYMWKPEELIEKLQEIILLKEKKLKQKMRKLNEYDELWLLVVCDEPAIWVESFSEIETKRKSCFMEKLSKHYFSVNNVFDKGYFMLSYDPSREGYPLETINLIS